VSAASWAWVMDKAGAEESPSIIIVCALPVHVVVSILRLWVDEVHPSYTEQVKIALTFNGVRLMYGLELADYMPPPAPVAAVQLPVITNTPTTGPASLVVKIKLSQIIDQGSDQEICMLDLPTLARYAMRATVRGVPPVGRARKMAVEKRRCVRVCHMLRECVCVRVCMHMRLCHCFLLHLIITHISIAIVHL